MDELLEKSEAFNSEFYRIFEHGCVNESITARWLMGFVVLEHSVSLRQFMLKAIHLAVVEMPRR